MYFREAHFQFAKRTRAFANDRRIDMKLFNTAWHQSATCTSVTNRTIAAICVFANSVAIGLFVAICSSVCDAQSPSMSSCGEVWEISTRHLPCSACNVATPTPFEVHRWSNCRWERRTIEAATDAVSENGDVPLTIIYVHGNWMERDNARERVRIINSYVAKSACEPYRILMFSWPSQRDNRILADVRENAQCAEAQAFYFASLLQLVSANSERVSVLGFSFGARTISGGLHLNAGGTLPGTPILGTGNPNTRYRVSLVAPAIDRDWLETNGRHRYAMNNVDQLINLYNSRDPILRRFRFIDSIASPIAAGFAGFAGFDASANPRSTEPLIASDRIKQYDCGTQIGSTHSERDYYGKCPHFQTAINNLLWKTP